MDIKYDHTWPTGKIEAYAEQEEAVRKVEIHGNTEEPPLVAAVDTAYGQRGEIIYAAAVVMTFPGLKEIERNFCHRAVSFPYHPGLLYYREGPAVIDALSDLQSDADLIMVAAHGIAHPKRCGMACQIGIAFDKPSIGCSRKLLTGSHKEVGATRSSSQLIVHNGKEIGVAHRSRDNVKPIFISPGHKCDIPLARSVVLQCLRGYRLPEPLRLAHLLANRHKHYVEKNMKPNQQHV